MFDMQDELFEKIKYTIDFVHPSDLYDEEDNAELYEDEHWNELVEYLQADKVAWGASKVVFWFQQIKNYVIKIPLMGCYEGYEEDYVKLTEAIAEECSALLLDYTSPTSLNFQQDSSKESNISDIISDFISNCISCLAISLAI